MNPLGTSSPQELVEERTQLLLTEMLGETVKVRGLGYKTMRRARVRAFEPYQGQFLPRFEYEDEDRQQAVRLIKRLDVMTPDGWATVWEDDQDDLMPHDRENPATSAKPTGLKYRTGMLG